MRLTSSLAAAAALLASLPAAAYSTRYEVRHYPAAFTRTVNGALGTSTETYADGTVVLGDGTTPAPSLAVTASQGGAVGFDIDSSYEFAVAAAPLSPAAQALLVALGRTVPHIKVGEAAGVITLAAATGVSSQLDAVVGQPRGTSFTVACDDGIRCGTTRFHTALFLDALGYNPYACTTTCPPVAPGTPLTLLYNMTAHVRVSTPGATVSLLIDPVITLDPGFLSDAGLTARDFSLTPEPGFGNGTGGGTGGVPELASWLLLTVGFGLVGARLRRRNVVAA